MYTILTKPELGPVIVSINNPYYCDYIMANYEVVYEGTKEECESIKDDMITAFCD